MKFEVTFNKEKEEIEIDSIVRNIHSREIGIVTAIVGTLISVTLIIRNRDMTGNNTIVYTKSNLELFKGEITLTQ